LRAQRSNAGEGVVAHAIALPQSSHAAHVRIAPSRKGRGRSVFTACMVTLLAAACSTTPPDLTDEPPIDDAVAEPATPVHAAALDLATLHSAPTKAPRLLNAAVEVHDLHAPAMQPEPAIVPHPRKGAVANPVKADETAPPGATPAPQKNAMLSPQQHFEWPVEGKILSGFGSNRDGARNDGINIAAEPGTPIHAAAAGTVTYAARLKGYGNLVLIRHDNGYITAYAHAQSLLVAPGDRVDRGDVIGLSGKSGDVASPQLHFEIREGTKPVDPRPLLLSSRES